MHLRRSDLHRTTVDGSAVLLDTRTSQYLTVNGSGTVLLDALAEDTTESDLTDLLVGRYGLDPDAAATDCASFLEQLRQLDFLAE